MMLLLRYLRYGCIAAIIAGGAWLMLAPSDAGTVIGPVRPARPTARITLRVMPGPFYAPGITPGGIGTPNRAFAEVCAAYEALHPDVAISIEPSLGAVREYLVTQLSAGKAPDIVMVNVEDVWADVHKEWYVPLDATWSSLIPTVSPASQDLCSGGTNLNTKPSAVQRPPPTAKCIASRTTW